MGVGGFSFCQVGEKEVKQPRLVLTSKAGVWKLVMNDFPLKDAFLCGTAQTACTLLAETCSSAPHSWGCLQHSRAVALSTRLILFLLLQLPDILGCLWSEYFFTISKCAGIDQGKQLKKKKFTVPKTECQRFKLCVGAETGLRASSAAVTLLRVGATCGKTSKKWLFGRS